MTKCKRGCRLPTQRQAGDRPRRSSAPPRCAARGARRHLAEGRVLAVRAVRLLHRAHRRQGDRQLPAVAGQDRRQDRDDAGRRRTPKSVPRSPTRSPRAAACSAGSASRASSCAPRRRSTRRAPTCNPATWPATSAPTCAAAPATSRSSTPSRRSPRASTSSRRWPATVGGAGAKYEAGELALGDRDYIDDMRVPGMLHAALHLTAHARADILSIDTAAAAAAPGVVAVFTAADIPGELRVGIIHKDWPVMIPVGGRTSYARRRAGDRRRRDTSAGTRRCRAGRGRLRRADAGHRSRGGAGRRRSGRGVGHRLQRAQRQRVLARRRRRRSGSRRPHRARGVPHAAHRARVPRAGEHAGRADDRRWCTASAGVLRRPGRVGRPQRHRPRARRRQRPGHRRRWCRTAARSVARRT